jgi:hypothetical protein
MPPMRDELICRTCETGRLRLVTRRRHGWLAGMFGSVLVVVSIASLVVWLFGLFDAFGEFRHVWSEAVPILGVWLATSLLLGTLGAIALHKESVLACSNCRAIMHALEEDEVEKPAPVEESAAPRARPST